jgi:uncharacterized repeat protein (TIGR03803 family)
MKANLKNGFLLPAFIAALALLPAWLAAAQTFTNLHIFPYPGGGGAFPQSGLALAGNRLYGTAQEGGDSGYGTVFAIHINGTGYTNLYNFSLATPNVQGLYTNSDGAFPRAGLTLAGNTLYGVSQSGGSNAFGTVFKLNTNGSDFTVLYTFTNGSPGGGLAISGNTLYGTTERGGITVFAINTDGSGYTNLYSSTYGSYSYGFNPAGMVIASNALYWTEFQYPNEYINKINTDGTGYTNLYSVPDGGSYGSPVIAGLIISGHTLYGTAEYGGVVGNGAVFAANTDGSGYTNLYSFTAESADPYKFGNSTNNDGAFPVGLTLSSNILCGMAGLGGDSGQGTVFAVNTDGLGFTNLYSFTGITDGSQPQAGPILSGNTLYGTAEAGGDDSGDSSGYGTIFSISGISLVPVISPPQLTIVHSGTNVILNWSATGLKLQSTTNLASPQWVLVTGQNTVTNPIAGTRKFYRLSH